MLKINPELLEAHAAIDIDNADFSTTCAFHLEGEPIRERQWTVDGAIPHENVTLLSGDGGLGN